MGARMRLIQSVDWLPKIRLTGSLDGGLEDVRTAGRCTTRDEIGCSTGHLNGPGGWPGPGGIWPETGRCQAPNRAEPSVRNGEFWPRGDAIPSGRLPLYGP